MIRFVGTLKTFFFNFGKPLFFGLCGITLILTAYSNCSQLRSLKQNSASFLDKDDLVEMYSFASTGQIIGNVEGISDMGNYIVVSGWACEVGNPDARDVHIKISAEGATTYAGARSPDLYRELEV
ncbi:MAG: hypothetical protein KDD35_11630, partial [Bdellovibrionales bacterium]|nr:hypothetical protein [Bdellovibrionales bacterium]